MFYAFFHENDLIIELTTTENLVVELLFDNLPAMRHEQHRAKLLAMEITEKLQNKVSHDDLKSMKVKLKENIVSEVLTKVQDLLDTKYLNADETTALINGSSADTPLAPNVASSGIAASLRWGLSKIFRRDPVNQKFFSHNPTWIQFETKN